MMPDQSNCRTSDGRYASANGHVTHREFSLWKEGHQREHDLASHALDTATATMSDRLKGMNEVREQLREQASHFVNREVADICHAGITRDVAALRDSLAETKRWQSGIEGRTIGLSAAIGVVVIIITLALKFMP